MCIRDSLYTLFQYCYQLGTMLLCGIWFNHKHAAFCFLNVVFLWAGRNGATYYIDYYGKKFEKEVLKLKLEVEELRQQLDDKGTSISLDDTSTLSLEDE